MALTCQACFTNLDEPWSSGLFKKISPCVLSVMNELDPDNIRSNDKNLFVRNVVFWAFFTAPSSRLHYFWALASKKKKRKRGVGNFAFWLSFVLIWVWFVALIILTWRLQSTLQNRQNDTFFWNYHYLYFKTLQKASAFREKLFWPSQTNLTN